MSNSFIVQDGSVELLSLRGFGRAHQDLVGVVEDPLFLHAKHRSPGRRVGLISGGGSGHEPLHIGFLGRGMLDAVAPGRVFASPHNRQIYEASRHAAGPDGVLHIVKNYTGDRINFGIAAERLAHDGIPVRRVLVDDDIATDSADTATGRRGTAATVVVEKLLGAAADDGWGIDQLADLGAAVAAASRSLAVASRAHTSIHTGMAAFSLDPGTLEYGVGIHGERAAASIEWPPLPELVGRMCTEILEKLPTAPRRIALVVNGLGATTQIELHMIFEIAAQILEANGADVAAALVGTFVPALDMHGFSLSITELADEWVEWFQRPVSTPSYPTRGLS
ncbi:MAG: dihydroxyacetone kinase subunit DhaK [Frankiaceae bacterium]